MTEFHVRARIRRGLAAVLVVQERPHRIVHAESVRLTEVAAALGRARAVADQERKKAAADPWSQLNRPGTSM
jgi:hypothetical protein